MTATQVWTLSAADRFGDHGVVGVLALDGRRIELVSISCRVLALGVAAVFVSEVLRVSKAIDLDGCQSPYAGTATSVPHALARAHLALTARNTPCHSLFSDLGFIQVASTSSLGIVRSGSGRMDDGSTQWELLDAASLPPTDHEIYSVAFAEQ